MVLFQHILAYLILALAVGYLVKKYLLPKSRFARRKNQGKGCGNDNCGCH